MLITKRWKEKMEGYMLLMHPEGCQYTCSGEEAGEGRVRRLNLEFSVSWSASTHYCNLPTYLSSFLIEGGWMSREKKGKGSMSVYLCGCVGWLSYAVDTCACL